MAIYLFVWLLTYHATFAIRESVTLAPAWREAAPWLLLAGPVCVVLGISGSVAHKSGILGDVCLTFPIAWSIPEFTQNLKEGWLYASVVALPAAALALSPLLTVGRRDVRFIRVVIAYGLFGVVSMGVLPVVRNQIHS